MACTSGVGYLIMEKEAISIHYNEIALKGKLRSKFEDVLRKNIDYETGNLASTLQGRLFLGNSDENTLNLLKLTPGVSWVSKAMFIDRDTDMLIKVLKELVSRHGNKVNLDVRRIDKSFPRTSLEVKQKLIKDLGLKLSTDGYRLRIEITNKEFIVNYNIEKAIGGMPVGSAGNIISLFSGGIDSAVAPIEMMKRGCSVDLLHVYAMPDSNLALSGKIAEIASRLSLIEPVRLYLVPFHFFNLKVTEINPRYELVLFKRFLLKLAEEMCYRYNYKGLSTGDSLSQVASQTLDNINAISYGFNVPIFRPLLSHNKEEIIEKAKLYSTYEMSIKSYKDCCSLVSKKPLTAASKIKVEEFENKIGLDKIINDSLSQLAIASFIHGQRIN